VYYRQIWVLLAPPAGLEPATTGLEVGWYCVHTVSPCPLGLQIQPKRLKTFHSAHIFHSVHSVCSQIARRMVISSTNLLLHAVFAEQKPAKPNGDLPFGHHPD